MIASGCRLDGLRDDEELCVELLGDLVIDCGSDEGWDSSASCKSNI